MGRRAAVVSVVALLALRLDAQTISAAKLASVPSSDVPSPTPNLIQAADGAFYGDFTEEDYLSAGAPFYRLTLNGQYSSIKVGEQASQLPSAFLQGPDGYFYGSGFRLSRSGALTYIHSFSGGSDGNGSPSAVTPADDGYFYGFSVSNFATPQGGGVLYRFTPSGEFQILYTMNPATDGWVYYGTNLVQGLDGNLYGTASSGGPGYSSAEFGGATGNGTVFRFTKAGAFELLHAFTGGADGFRPGGLTAASDGNLYGYTSGGGDTNACETFGCGAIFRIDLKGNFSVIHTVEDKDQSPQNPYLAIPGGQLIGSPGTGANDYDGLSEVSTQGEIRSLYIGADFDTATNSLGWISPFSPGSDGNLYSMASSGGAYDAGILFRLNFSPELQPPVQLRLSATTTSAGAAVAASYTINNAFSLSMQQCYGFQSINGQMVPLGKAPGTYDTATQLWTGSATFPAPNTPGTYNYALTCGGVESGYAALQVGYPTATALSVTPETITPPGAATLTATVTSGGGVPSSGNVTFSADGVTLGIAALGAKGVASITASSSGVAAGSYPVVATYAGSSEYIGSASSAVTVTVK